MSKRSMIALGLASCGLCLAAEPIAPTPTPTAAPSTKVVAPVSHLDIWEIDVDGNTVLDEATIDRVVEPFLGPGRTPDDVDAARSALEAIYRERGYKTVSVSIPKQTVRDGVITLQVDQAPVGHLNVIGSKYHSIDQIKLEAPSLAEGQVPDFDQVQHDLVGLNQQPDRVVTPALKAGSRPGTVDVDLVVKDNLPLHGSLELNNQRSQDTSELRALASLSYGNLWQRGHSLSLSFQTAPERFSDARVIYGSYLAPFRDSPWSLLISGLHSGSDVSTVGGTDVVGKGTTVGARAVLDIPASSGAFTVTAGADYKRYDTKIALGSDQFATPIEYVPFTLGFSALLRRDSSITQSDFSLVFASPKIGSSSAVYQLNRADARGQSFYIRESISHTQELPLGLQLGLRANSQLTDQPLISNEQLSAGGYNTVRGYLEAEALGDYGFGGTLELRSPSFADHIGSVNTAQELRLFSFVDGARLLVRSPTPGQQSEFDLLGIGVGFNARLFNYFNGSLVWSEPVLDGVATKAWNSRLLFRVWTSF